MKKRLISILALVLVAAMAIGFAACGSKDPAETTATLTLATIPTTETTEEPITDAPTEPVDASLTDPTETDTETTTDPAITTIAQTGTETTEAATTTKAEPADPNAPPANLGSLSKAEQLAYFNKAANRVRTAKPGFKYAILKTLGKMEFTGIVNAVSGIIDSVKKSLMPGEWEYDTIAKGKGNDGNFLSENTNASDLRASDVTSISSKKSGENWVITVKVIQENNPAKGTGSANSRINCIASRQEVLDEITNISSVISADVNNCTLTYHDGYATITVNPKGQVIASESGFLVNALANDVKITIIKTNVTAPQSTVVKCTDFAW